MYKYSPMDYGFDTVIFELPSYKILKQDDNFLQEEIDRFKTIVERGAGYFFDITRNGGIQSA